MRYNIIKGDTIRNPTFKKIFGDLDGTYDKIMKREYQKAYSKRAYVKAKRAQYYARLEVKIHRNEQRRAYRARPEVKAHMKLYNANPKVKEYHLKYSQLPKVKAKRKLYAKLYWARPEVRERQKEYKKRPEVREHIRTYARSRGSRAITLPARLGGEVIYVNRFAKQIRKKLPELTFKIMKKLLKEEDKEKKR